MTLRHFKPSEFKYFERCDPAALAFLDDVRERCGFPLIVTDDWRDARATLPSGASPTSLHFAGRAFDLRWPSDAEKVWRFVAAVVKQQEVSGLGVELELVNGPSDRHLHVGVYANARPSRCIVAAD